MVASLYSRWHPPQVREPLMCSQSTHKALAPACPAPPQVVASLKAGHQVMVFVHSRKDTGKTARVLADLAAKNGDSELFSGQEHPMYGLHFKEVRRGCVCEMCVAVFCHVWAALEGGEAWVGGGAARCCA